MDTTRQIPRRLLTIGSILFLAVGLILTLPACSDDPILGPNDGEESDDGGSYSSINRLSPPSPAADSTAPAKASTLDLTTSPNPERF
jgi:hypothetical protein